MWIPILVRLHLYIETSTQDVRLKGNFRRQWTSISIGHSTHGVWQNRWHTFPRGLVVCFKWIGTLSKFKFRINDQHPPGYIATMAICLHNRIIFLDLIWMRDPCRSVHAYLYLYRLWHLTANIEISASDDKMNIFAFPVENIYNNFGLSIVINTAHWCGQKNQGSSAFHETAILYWRRTMDAFLWLKQSIASTTLLCQHTKHIHAHVHHNYWVQC